MPAAKLSAIDPNLLVVLDALLTEHSVSRAARRLEVVNGTLGTLVISVFLQAVTQR